MLRAEHGISRTRSECISVSCMVKQIVSTAVACVTVSAFDIDRLSRLSERDEVYCRRLLFLPCVRVKESRPIELGAGPVGRRLSGGSWY